MDMLFLPGQNYDCLRCGKTCRSKVRIHVDPASRRRVESSDVGRLVGLGPGEPPVVEEPDGAVVAARKDGHCAFLRADDLCALQAELGVDAKPLGCRQYPLFLRPTPEGLVVGVSFFCTAVQRNHGRPLAAQADEIAGILQGIRLRPLGLEPLPLSPEVAVDWAGYRALERFLEEGFLQEEAELRLGRALLGLAGLAGETARNAPAGTVLDASAVELALRRARPLEEHPVLASQEAFCAAALVAMVESPDPERTPELTRDLLEGRRVHLPLLDWTGTTADLVALDPAPEAPAQTLRYLWALLHRKFLALDRPVVDNLVVLRLVPRLLRFYAAVAARRRGVGRPELEDVHRAFDVLELDMVSHARGLDGLFAAFGGAFRSLASP